MKNVVPSIKTSQFNARNLGVHKITSWGDSGRLPWGSAQADSRRMNKGAGEGGLFCGRSVHREI